jgi:hypothetical protein
VGFAYQAAQLHFIPQRQMNAIQKFDFQKIGRERVLTDFSSGSELNSATKLTQSK